MIGYYRKIIILPKDFMQNSRAKELVTQLFRTAGIIINGTHPWDIHIHNDDFYIRILRDGEMGLGESYMDGWWDSPRVDMLIERLFEAETENYIKSQHLFSLRVLLTRLFSMPQKSPLPDSSIHYDLGNLLFQAMLGKHLLYSCGYWTHATTLEEAQIAKMDLICRKLLLEPGMRILEVGCGWGTFAKYAADKYGVSVVGVTVSKQQFQYAKKLCENSPIEIRLQDFHEVKENFDRIVSIGTFKHIPFGNYENYMQFIHKHLTRDGIFLLDTFGRNKGTATINSWMTKYIFPNTVTPAIGEISKAFEGLLVMEDWHNFGADFDKTVMAWHENFNANWDSIKVYYDERFFRMWNYYLLACAAGFRSRVLQSWQIVLSRSGVKDGYRSIRE
jgi:cyclopropane-fatty-acyl-phospholipid synthase